MTARSRPGLGYRYLPLIDAFSAGVAAEDGHAIGRLDLAAELSLTEGFALLDSWLADEDLAPSALVAMHLRSPAPATDAEFAATNSLYRSLLADRGILDGDANPVARSNVAPAGAPPGQVSIHSAFVLVGEPGAAGDFVAAGSAETTGGSVATGAVVDLDDTSDAAMRRKVDVVLDTMLDRLHGLGVDGSAPTLANVYTVHEIAGLHDQVVAKLPAVDRWGYQRWQAFPPVVGMEFEMDLTRVSWTQVIGR